MFTSICNKEAGQTPSNICDKIKYFDAFITYGIGILCALLPVAFYLPTHDSVKIKYLIMQISITVLSGVFIIRNISWDSAFSRTFKDNKWLFVLFLLYLSWGFFSYLITPYKTFAIQGLINRILCLLIFVIACTEIRSVPKIRTIIYFFFVGVIISCLYGIIQFSGIDPFAWKGAFGKRVFSTAGNPSIFASFLILISPLVIIELFVVRKKFILALIGVFVIYFMMMVSYSRNGYIALMCAIVLLIYLLIRLKSVDLFEKKALKYLCIGTVILSITGVCYLLPREKGIDSYGFDVRTWSAASKMIKSNFIKGTGIGTFEAAFPPYRNHETMRIWGMRGNSSANHPHNSYLNMLAEEGIIGFGIYLLIVLLVMKSFSEYLRNNPDHIKALYLIGLISAIAGYMIQDVFWENSKFTFVQVYFWLFLGMGMGLATHSNISEKNGPTICLNKSRLRIFQLSIVVAMLYTGKYFIDVFVANVYFNKAVYFSKKGEWDSAIKNYNESLALDSNNITAHYFLGNSFLDRWKENDPEKALTKYLEVIKYAPNYVMVNHNLAVVYMRQGDYLHAIEYFKKSLSINPIYVPTYKMIAECYRKSDDEKSADEYLQKASLENTRQ